MKKTYILLILLLPTIGSAQTIYFEQDFETSDPITNIRNTLGDGSFSEAELLEGASTCTEAGKGNATVHTTSNIIFDSTQNSGDFLAHNAESCGGFSNAYPKTEAFDMSSETSQAYLSFRYYISSTGPFGGSFLFVTVKNDTQTFLTLPGNQFPVRDQWTTYETTLPLSTNVSDVFIEFEMGGGNATAIDDLVVSDTSLFDYFITTWEVTDGETITIPTTGTGYDYTVDWGDGTVTAHSDADPSTDAVHTYTTAGTYTVKLTGDFPRIYFNDDYTNDYSIRTVEQWGAIEWTSFENAFAGCADLYIPAADAPDLANVSSFRNAFGYCWNLAGDLNHWDTSTVTNMSYAFNNITSNNVLISSWDTGAVTDFQGMFADAAGLFNQDISGWDTSNATNLSYMFYGTGAFDQNIGGWDISNVTTLEGMFEGAGLSTANYDATLTGWATDSSGTPGDGIDDIPTGITFEGGNSVYCASEAERNELINTYGWTITDGGASEACKFITTWNMATDNELLEIQLQEGGVGDSFTVDWGDGTVTIHLDTDFSAGHTYAVAGTYQIRIAGAFPGTKFSFGSHSEKILSVDQWGSIPWKSASQAFNVCTNLEVLAIDTPDLSAVSSMIGMFGECPSLTGSTGNWDWDTGSVTDMNGVFTGGSFNGDITGWDTSNVTIMIAMFRNNPVFNRDLSGWDTSNVLDMDSMFQGASGFNADLSSWDVSQVTDMYRMFREAVAFDRDLGDWDLGNVTDMGEMFEGAGLSTVNYDATLTGWATDSSGTPGDGIDDIPTGITFDGGNSTYCNAGAARDLLIDTYGWTITDGGLDIACVDPADFFITTWNVATDNELLEIQLQDGGVGDSFTVDWGDGTVTIHLDTDFSAGHTYAVAGTYQIRIAGAFPGIQFVFSSHSEKILSVDQWGSIPWKEAVQAFSPCTNLEVLATDVPDLSAVSSMSGMFSECSNLTGSTGNWDWDTGSVTTMNAVFAHGSFNGDITGWDTSNVTIMLGLFNDNPAFNRDLSGWDTSNVLDMESMFWGASGFNADLSSWDVSQVTDMYKMFQEAVAFDRDLGDWDLGNVTDMGEMFEGAGLSTVNYDATLTGWATDSSGTPGDGIDDIPTGITFDGGNSTYCNAGAARDLLINTYGWTITDGGLDCDFVRVVPNVYLQGAYTAPATPGLMDDDLRSGSLLPTASPYDGDSCAASVFDATGSDAVVDWVWVELRDKNDSGTVLGGRSALLQRDGDVVSTDGVSPLSFEVAPDDYYVSVNHHSHLGIMTATALALSNTPVGADMAGGPSQVTGGTLSVIDMGDGIYALMGGDIDADGQTNNSDLILLQAQVGNAGYNSNDLDMNGQIQNSDVFLLQLNIGNGEQF